jgi:superfamily I DNA/RNA helicase
MNDNRLIIAAAGSGKTRTLIEEALSIVDENVLITTFTEANEAGIKSKIIEATGGFIPQNIKVQTWYAFLLQQGIRPFQSCLDERLWAKKIGFYLVSGVSATYISEKKDLLNHYFTKDFKVYSDKAAKFVVRCDEKTNGEIIKRITKIYPNIFVDEVQDLAGYDLELLKLLFISDSKTLLVGDPRQGTYSTNNSRKNKKFGKSNITHFFESREIESLLDIDDSTLTVNYRSNEKICSFSNRLFSEFQPTTSGQKDVSDHDGVYIVKKDSVENYLEQFPNCVQLRWSSVQKINESYPVMNFGESKGLDFSRVLVYPTKKIKEWIMNNRVDLAPTSRSKFYVAITRAVYSVGIVWDTGDFGAIDGIEIYE